MKRVLIALILHFFDWMARKTWENAVVNRMDAEFELERRHALEDKARKLMESNRARMEKFRESEP